jgi:hypothetical protein
MSDEIPEEIREDITTMAKWAAHQDDPAKVGGQVAYFLGKLAEIRRDCTVEQRRAARKAAVAWAGLPGASDFAVINAELDRISGHEGINL